MWPFKTKSAAATQTHGYGSASLAALLAQIFGGGATKSGATVNTESALKVSTVLCCVRVIAEGVAQVPWVLMQEQTDGKHQVRLPMRKHPLFDLLHRKPNRWQTSFAFRETLIFHILLGPKGCAYAFKSRVGSDRKLRELILLDPHRVREEADADGNFRYWLRGKDGAQRELAADDVWRIPGPSWTGTEALPLLDMAREAIGLTMATEETQAKLHARGVRTSGVYSVEGQLNKGQYQDLKDWIVKEFGGAENSGVPMILDRNAKWTPTTMTGVDAQHVETRRLQVEEVCRSMRVLPIMAMQQDKASTYASVEQMLIAHLVHTLMPWFERLEQAADCELLTDQERSTGYYTLLNHVALLRGALRDTAEFLSKLVDRGVMTRNEGRAYLDLNPLDGLDVPLTPSNALTSSQNDPA
jgi:HK97 family phage portal protein